MNTEMESPETLNEYRWTELLKQCSSEKLYHSLFDYLRDEIEKMEEKPSFYTLDLGDILLKIDLWKKNMPNVRPFYAVKTNSDPTLLRFLSILKFSFDCATEGELRMVIEAGGDPRNIIFAHTIKTAGALKYARSVGVDLMTFDGEEELFKIQKYHPQARLLLRLIPEDVKCSFDLSEKFGCHLEDAKRLLMQAKDLNLNVIGISFHVGGLCKNSKSYTATIETSRKVFDQARELGLHFSILDIGGGFEGAKSSERSFPGVTQAIRKALDSNFSELDIEVIAEPGTYFVASAGILSTSIFGVKKRVCRNKTAQGDQDGNIERFYYLNDSIYGSFFVGVEEYGMVQHPLLDESKMKQRPIYKSKLWGQTCCGNDVLLKECLLPAMEEGEYMVWYNMGAYCHVLCSSFCGVPIPSTRHIFIYNPSLNWKSITNAKEVENFIIQSCCLVVEA